MLSYTAPVALTAFGMLGLYEGSSSGNNMGGGFTRKFHGSLAVETRETVDLGKETFYIAGTTSDRIFLGDFSSPLTLKVIGLPALDTQSVKILVDCRDCGDFLKDMRKLRTKVDSPYFFLVDGARPALMRGRIGDWHAARFMADDHFFFEDAVPTGVSSFALRSYSLVTREYELAIGKMDSPYFEFRNQLLERQVDGMFCVQGSLHYDDSIDRLVYVYTYRNEYIVMDSSLNLIDRRHTIDTFTTANLKVARLQDGTTNTLAMPPSIVNSVSCVAAGLLYVNSNIIADNEDRGRFMRNAVIDVYEIMTGRYVGSFYVPRYKGKKISRFQVFGNCLVALVDNFVVAYVLAGVT